MTTNIKGFTIIQAIIAIIILGLISTVFVQMITRSTQGQRAVGNNIDFEILKNSVASVTNSKVCDGAFRTTAGTLLPLAVTGSPAPGAEILASPLTIDQIVVGTNVVAKPNQTLGGGMSITKLQFTSAVYQSDQTVAGVLYKNLSATLLLEATKAAGSFGGNAPFTQTMVFSILVNASTKLIEKCSSASAPIPGTALICTDLGRVWTPTATPPCAPPATTGHVRNISCRSATAYPYGPGPGATCQPFGLCTYCNLKCSTGETVTYGSGATDTVSISPSEIQCRLNGSGAAGWSCFGTCTGT